MRSYVLGYYKAARGEDRLSAKPVPLRDHNDYSVVLAYFYNEGYDRGMTLAQVFWQKDGQARPERLYVVSDRSLFIANDFAGFGSDIGDLRRRLRSAPGVRLYDHFPRYGADFRRHFGIETGQALDLFHQTVSMKSVGNLTDFVRSHMLEPFPVEERIEALIDHFDDLDRAYKAVLNARAQIEALQPLIGDIDTHRQIATEVAELRAGREALRPWFALRKGGLLQERINALDDELEQLRVRIDTYEQTHRREQAERDDLVRAIAESGGDRINQLERALADERTEQQRRKQRAAEYKQVAAQLQLDDIRDVDGFLANRRTAQKVREQLEDKRAAVQNALTEAAVSVRDIRTQHETIAAELMSLRERRTNIPGHMVALRGRLCGAMGLSEQELPFAGELIEVRDDAKEWEGAIERLLHNFGLSLLVSDRHYAQVAEWVDRTDLRGRIVYYRTRERRAGGGRGVLPHLHPQSVVRKLTVRADSGFHDWLERELMHRFDYACCSDLEQFRREERAITRSGQMKDRGARHEKDDRRSISDRTRYILGWSNEAKIAALEQEASALQRRLQTAAAQYVEAQTEEERLRERDGLYIRLEGFREFQEMDWRATTVQIERLTGELQQLRASSDRLRVLEEQRETLEKKMQRTERLLLNARDKQSTRKDRRDRAMQQLTAAQEQAALASAEMREQLFSTLQSWWDEAFTERKLTVETCDDLQVEMREWVQARIDTYDKRMERLRDRIIDAMRRYKSAYPLETQDVDVNMDAAEEYGRMLQQLQVDDLPRFEEEFERLLRENTIREVANFQGQLNRERELISERIATINRSLHEIDYNPNRYIRLHDDRTNDVEVREFITALRACTEGTLTGSEDEQYSEQKFMQVKAIIERFRGRDGLSDLDRRWTRYVTDVRNWFVFSASERWREDDAEYEHYTDAAGKSGGQKEKLAYTVLAASIAYQFGLEWGETRSRSFRFVVIDEAFGRGSDESARYGLELFQKLNLQLLIVTPLQKIHVIEPYVASVAFVHNEDDRNSMVRNLTIKEYHAERAAHEQAVLEESARADGGITA